MSIAHKEAIMEPTEQEIRAVRGLYLALCAQRPYRSKRGRQVARELGVSYKVIGPILFPIRAKPRKRRRRKHKRRTITPAEKA